MDVHAEDMIPFGGSTVYVLIRSVSQNVCEDSTTCDLKLVMIPCLEVDARRFSTVRVEVYVYSRDITL